jgi:hypothetical protein
MCSMSTDRNKGRISRAKETLPTFFTKTSNDLNAQSGGASGIPTKKI